MKLLRAPLSLFLAFLVAPAGLSQSSGFPPGEILHYSPFVTGTGPTSGAIVRLNPLSGQASIVKPLTETQYRPGSMCFDPFRDRVLFYGNPGPTGVNMSLHTLDASGQTVELGFATDRLQVLTPGAGGKVYFHDESGANPAPLRYLDASNVRRDLMDASGAQPFNHPGLVYLSAMIYDPGTNALLVAIRSNIGLVLCAGGSDLSLTLLRLSLSADGTRVLSTHCTQVASDPLGGNLPVGLSRIPDGDVLLAVDTNSNASQARLWRVDPVTLATSPFAFNGPYTGAAVTDAACYSSLRGQALLLDNFNIRLLSFSEGGAGVEVPTSMPLAFGGMFGFNATMIEVPGPGCSSTIAAYCTAKTTSGGCSPVLSTTGSPSASAGSGFVVRASQVQAGNFGLLFYGTSGAAAAPLQGGFLCVQPPTTRTSPQASGGATPCAGQFALDFNAWVATGFDPELVAGAVVNAQYWFRDPPHPISGTGLTGGVTFTLCP